MIYEIATLHYFIQKFSDYKLGYQKGNLFQRDV
mgnify:CR=1 FL=1